MAIKSSVSTCSDFDLCSSIVMIVSDCRLPCVVYVYEPDEGELVLIIHA